MPLMLRLPVYFDEGRVRELNDTCSTERFDFLAGAGTLSSTADTDSTANTHWTDFLDSVMRQHEEADLAAGWLPADFLLAEIRGDNDWEDEGPIIVGRVSIRYGLTENLLNYDGHLGYAVAPEFRRQGHATEILRQSLTLLASRGIHRVLVTCDEDNVGSATVIEANGGVLEDLRFKPGGSVPKRRYWISH
ncbi:GNAT family N-acetyltransferase [Corynebacterium sp.]|uniref:GNAT family N-acetyltransferase n=1 Tax=Corynebacterium sp. TaxID=1720 RepID=UPI0028A5B957|nr:GNAT family N-acetyltransferase [Corynebacterium sp.]